MIDLLRTSGIAAGLHYLPLDYIEQIPLPVRQAVLGNVGIHISFRIGHTDAEVLAREFEEKFAPTIFVDFDRYAAIDR